jgi:hypothetical protein
MNWTDLGAAIVVVWLCCRCVGLEGVLRLNEGYEVRETMVLISEKEGSGTV